ncbi:hypothetical protein N8A98_00935 (plasmid) [Devosia neptuniae]|uniref:Uncharacterized protein n=1 Tax=Devosia neptuniae TaxID=191302 RepID=A0ABY6CAK6_9HYPH|nr:hypothetical protein [Devosia neptuniae]UXN68112.1 hypothetical protein N8A98_00935 [Devosia neptuniae]
MRAGVLPLPAGMMMPSAIRDAAPDAWGRRVIINRMLGRAGMQADPAEIDELTYMLQSGSDRIGPLDFQRSAKIYVPRDEPAASLAQMQEAADLVQTGVKLPKALDVALFHGSAVNQRAKNLVCLNLAAKHSTVRLTWKMEGNSSPQLTLATAQASQYRQMKDQGWWGRVRGS